MSFEYSPATQAGGLRDGIVSGSADCEASMSFHRYKVSNAGLGMFKKLHDVPDSNVTVHIDGVAIAAEASESVAAVLLRDNPMWARTSPISEARRAPYCMMGVCFECLALVDGVSVQTCLVQVRNGMKIERQLGRRSIVS